MYNRGLFHDWVPKLGMLFLIIMLLLVYMLVSPIYNGNIGLMVSSTGMMSEYFMWAMYASSIGMGVAIPLVMRVKLRFRSKEIMIAVLLLMALFSIVIATASSPYVIVACSFLFGFVKLFGMLEIILPVQFMLSPKGDRPQFYSSFYPIAIILGQLGGFFAAKLSLNSNWQMIHFYSATILLSMALICIVFMHNLRFARKVPLFYIDWLSVLLLAGSMILLAYVFSFGKQQAWFVSSSILWATIVSISMGMILVIRSFRMKHPYISFKHYGLSNILYGSLLIAAQGMFMGASTIQSIFTNGILGYNWMVNSSLSLMSIPGMVVAGLLSFHWNKNKLPLKMFIFSGFAAYLLYVVMLYFMMVPELNFERWFLPQFLNGYAMCNLFIAVWIYTLSKVPQKDMLISVNGVMLFRSFIAMAFFNSLISWMQYRLQWQSVNNLAFYFDGALMSTSPGFGNFRDVQLVAVLAANKTLLGYIIIAGIALLVFILFHRFGRLKYLVARYRLRQSVPDNLFKRLVNLIFIKVV
jgi:MFS transporter, DHA2 family, multidrug resistance protein